MQSRSTFGAHDPAICQEAMRTAEIAGEDQPCLNSCTAGMSPVGVLLLLADLEADDAHFRKRQRRIRGLSFGLAAACWRLASPRVEAAGSHRTFGNAQQSEDFRQFGGQLLSFC